MIIYIFLLPIFCLFLAYREMDKQLRETYEMFGTSGFIDVDMQYNEERNLEAMIAVLNLKQ